MSPYVVHTILHLTQILHVRVRPDELNNFIKYEIK